MRNLYFLKNFIGVIINPFFLENFKIFYCIFTFYNDAGKGGPSGIMLNSFTNKNLRKQTPKANDVKQVMNTE